MNICIVTRADLRPTNHGAAVKIVETARSFAVLGHRAFITTSDRDTYLHVNADAEFEYRAFPSRYRAMEEWPLIGRGESIAERLCKWVGYPIEEYFLYSAQFDPAWLIRLIAVGLVEKVDVFQAEFPGYGVVAHLASRIVGRLRKAAVQSSIVQHNVEWARLMAYGHSVGRIRQMEKRALQMVDDVIAVSQEDKNLMIDMGISSNSITVIPHGVDFDGIQRGMHRRSELRKYWKVDGKTVVFFHGTLHYAPNTEAVRFIAERLLPLIEREPDLDSIQFVITGLNPPKYYSHPRIVFTDAVDDLAGHVHMADIFLCPLFDGGGTRLKLLEYMAVGRPIITTRKGAEGIPDLGQFTYAETEMEMFAALKAIVQETTKDATRKRLAQRLSWKNVGGCYLDLYQTPETHRGQDLFADLLTRPMDLPAVESEFLPKYSPVKERTMLLLINRGCNLTCSFCDLWDNPQNMAVEQLWSVLDDAQSIGTKVLVITGGEPFLHPELSRVIAEARSRGLAVNITTNGLLLKRHWGWLKDSGVSSLSFSLDGIGDVHDNLRGQQGAYERTVKAIRLVRSESDIPCSVYCTVTNQNVHQLWELYQVCTTLGVTLDFWPVNDAPDLYITSEEHKALWSHQVNAIINDNPAYANRRSFYTDSLRYHGGDNIENIRCLGFVEQYGVTYEGAFLPCCVWNGKGLVKGNVFETPLRTLWHSETIHRCRQDMVEQGCAVGCFNHSLYEYRNATT